MKTRKLGTLEVSELGAGCMSISANYGPPADRTRASRPFARHTRRASRSSTPPRSTARITNEDAGRRSARAFPGQGRDRHEVRLRHGGRRRPEQPPRAHQEGGRGFAEAPQDRPHRPLLPAPRRSQRADRRRRRCRQGTDPGGQGAALRPLRGERANHPAGACRAAGDGRPDRILGHGTGTRNETACCKPARSWASASSRGVRWGWAT